MKNFISILAIATLSLVTYAKAANAQPQSNFYKPIPLTGNQVIDVLTDKDIPTGQKGFARDYQIEAQTDERLEISTTSDAFDTIVSLLSKDGDVIAENDDGEPEGTNSLLFIKIKKNSTYVVRVTSFGGSSGGKFTLKIIRLRPVN